MHWWTVITVALGAAAPSAVRGGLPHPDSLVLDLETSLHVALERSYRIREFALELERDRENVRAARANLNSYAEVKLAVPTYDQSIREEFNSVSQSYELFRTSVARYLGQLRISQPLPTDGEISLNTTLFRKLDRPWDAEGEFNNKVFLEFRQPLLQANAVQIGIRRAELQLRNTELRFLDRKVELIKDVSEEFYELYRLSYEERLRAREVADLEASYETARRRFAAGELDELELLQLRSDLASRRDRLEAARGRLERKKSACLHLLGLPPDQEIGVDPALDYRPIRVDPDEAVRRALENRTSLRQIAVWREQNALRLEEARQRWTIQGELSFTLGLEGADPAFAQTFRRPDQTRSIALEFTVPIWDRGRHDAGVAAARAQLERSLLALESARRSVEGSARDAVRRVDEAQRRLGILEEGVAAAERAYELARARFETGAVTSQELALVEARLSRARQAYLEAYLDFRGALVDLLEATYWDFERNRPIEAIE